MLTAFLFALPFLMFIGIAIFQWLWNITIPGIFKTRQITFWEAFRLLLIGAMLGSGSFVKFNYTTNQFPQQESF